MKNKNKKIGFLTMSILGLASMMPISANAACPPTMAGTYPMPGPAGIPPTEVAMFGASLLVGQDCTDEKTVTEFKGSAAQSVNDITDKIQRGGEDIIKIYKDVSATDQKAMSFNSTELIKMLNSLNGSALADDMTRGRMIHEAKMNYMLELQDTKMKAENSPIGVNVTAEEMAFIAKFLGNNTERRIPEYIEVLKRTMDDKGKKIPVMIKSAKGVCENDPENPKACAVMKPITPGFTMEVLFDECSREKRVLVSSIKQQKAISKVGETMQKSQAESIEVVNTVQASAQMLKKQRKISCSPEEYNSEICGDGLSKREYSQAIVGNVIVNNGNISSSNFYNPPMVGSIDGKIDGFSKEDLELAGKNNIIFVGNEKMSTTPPLVNTYKSSNQYLAAIDMTDNIINEASVANQPLSDRKNLKNAEFQAGYLSRMAALSLSKYSLQNSVNDRVGSNVQGAVGYDRENPHKETFNGASTLDQLIFDIETDYKLISGKNKKKLDDKNEKALSIMMLEAQQKQNKLVLSQILRNERIELLLASILANSYNSPEYTEYLNNLRGK